MPHAVEAITFDVARIAIQVERVNGLTFEGKLEQIRGAFYRAEIRVVESSHFICCYCDRWPNFGAFGITS